ncbi:MAG: SLC13 family permease [Thiotrichales bacterium]
MSRRRWVARLALLGGPLLAWLAFHALPADYTNAAGEPAAFTAAGRATLAVLVWMAVWWLTEAIDVTATALLPAVLFPLLGIASMNAATAPYANSVIFLFLGGFLLAMSMQRWRLDRRIALLTLRLTGTRPDRMIGGFMLATACLSAFVSNTATVAMMLPIAASVIALVAAREGADTASRERGAFPLALLLGVAYAASIGGIATIIGTPPNVYLVGFIRDGIAEPFRRDIGFLDWMLIGTPLAVAFLLFAWVMLTRVLYPVGRIPIQGGSRFLRAAHAELGAPSRGEITTLVVFLLTATAWMIRPWLNTWSLTWGGEIWRPLGGLSDPGIALLGALALFILPANAAGERVMNWRATRDLPWGVLILFGGGLSLAAAVQANGVAEWLGTHTTALAAWPPWLVILLVVAAVVFLTELTSNTATTATLVPILAALAPGLGLHPYALIVPAAIGASFAFMMPVATPPNAIVFGTGHLTIPQMCRAGWWLNIVGIGLIMLVLYALIVPVLEFSVRVE